MGNKKKKSGLNQPCPCGSGRKFKKCCFFEGKKEEQAKKAPFVNNCNCYAPEEECESCHSYRFRVGDRVEASIRGVYQAGTIVALNYKEPGWLGTVPYQIHLDHNSHLVYAPFDEDDWVRAMPFELSEVKKRRRRPTIRRE